VAVGRLDDDEQSEKRENFHCRLELQRIASLNKERGLRFSGVVKIYRKRHLSS
jgi:hypothetical protein